MRKETLIIIACVLLHCGITTFVAEPHILDLKEHDFDYVVGRGHEVWALFFYLPRNKRSDAAAPAFKQAAKMMLGVAKFGSINVDKYPVLAHRFNIKKIPTLIFIDRESEEIVYTGRMTDAAIIDFIGTLLMQKVQYGKQRRLSDNKLVKELTDEEMIKNGKNGTKFWLIAYYDSKDNSTRADFTKMVEYTAETLEGSINVGAFDISKRSTPYMYDEIPTVVIFHGKRSDRYEVEYNDTFHGNKLVDFVLTRIKAPPVQELWTENILTEMCQLKKYCMLTFIPTIDKCNSECKANYQFMLEEVAEEFKTVSAGWALIRRGVMKTAERMLDINDSSQFPAFIIVEVKTLKAEYLVDKFNADNLKNLLSDILSGDGFTGRTIPLFDHLPNYRPWKRDEL